MLAKKNHQIIKSGGEKSVYTITRLFFELFVHFGPRHIVLKADLEVGKRRWLVCLFCNFRVSHDYNIA